MQQQVNLEREWLLATLERRTAQLQIAAEVSRAASAILDPEQLMHLAVSLIQERLDLYYAGLFLVDQSGEWTGEPNHWAVLRAGTGEAGQEMLARQHKLEIGDTSMIGWCIAHKKARIALDVGEDAVRFDNPLLPETRSELALPLIRRNEVIGAMTIQSTQKLAFSNEDILALQTLADQLANAIQNANLYNQAQHEIAERRQAEKELQERNEDLDAFAHTVAHDLKEPLTIIMLSIEVLKNYSSTELDPEMEEYIDHINHSTRKMNNIIQELMLLAGVRKAEVKMMPLNMGGIIAEAQERLTHLIAEKNVQITQPTSWPKALGYGPWVEEVWTNYISNAIKYGGHPPHIQLGADRLPNNQIRFWVRDNGPGVPPDLQSQLFKTFTRLKQAETQGHGLGLSIARRIVEKLNGEVGVESVPGEGSTFSFTLPAA